MEIINIHAHFFPWDPLNFLSAHHGMLNEDHYLNCSEPTDKKQKYWHTIDFLRNQ